MGYAQGTSVPESRSRIELETLLRRKRATEFAYGWSEGGQVLIGFRIDGFPVKLPLPLPDRDEFRHTPTGKERTDRQVQEHYDAECRRRWRALVAVVKAKFVAVEEGISTLAAEFLADIVMPNGQTMRQVGADRLLDAATEGKLPSLLPERTP